jgi:hypothetical protein
MASTNNVIFPESMADILVNPVDICFGSMPAKSTTPTAYLVIEGNAVTADQQIGTDLLPETHPPTPGDLIVGIDGVESMLSNIIKVCEHVKRPRRTSSPSWLAQRSSRSIMLHEAQDPDRIWTQDRGNHRSHLDEPCPINENPKHMARQCRVLRSFVDLLLRLIAVS